MYFPKCENVWRLIGLKKKIAWIRKAGRSKEKKIVKELRNNMIIFAFALCAVLVYITVKSVWGLFKNWKEMDSKSCLINITISIISVGGFAYILWKQKAIQDVIEFIKNL